MTELRVSLRKETATAQIVLGDELVRNGIVVRSIRDQSKFESRGGVDRIVVWLWSMY